MAHIPERMCIGCRKKQAKPNLMRVVMTDSGILVDKKQNITARGVYFCKCEECINLARKKKTLSRQFKKSVSDSVYDELLREVLDE